MREIFSVLGTYLSYDFVWFALIVGVLIALCAALFGVVLVLKRLSFIGDGLSHVAFGTLTVATVMDLTDRMLLVLPVTVVCAVLLLRSGRGARLKGDAAIAVVSVGALALGYLLMDLFSASGNVAGDVCSTLFGSYSILTLSALDVYVCLGLAVAVILIFAVFYQRIFAVTFDEEFARAIGVRASSYNLLIAVVTAVIIVLAMNLVGSLLISALVVFPALSAMRLCHSFRGVILTSSILSVTCALLGILLSLVFSTPVGPTVVAVDLLAYLVFAALGRILRG